MPKPLQISEKALTAIAEALFLAFTESQAAYLAGISERTLARIKQTERWQQILQKRLEFEKPFRRKIWNGAVGWQGAAWMLERQYATQLSKPEVQLNLTASSTTNNTLVITAEAARELQSRASIIDAQVEKLVASKRSASDKFSASSGPNPTASKDDKSTASTNGKDDASSSKPVNKPARKPSKRALAREASAASKKRG
jgi:hypothetical protein